MLYIFYNYGKILILSLHDQGKLPIFANTEIAVPISPPDVDGAHQLCSSIYVQKDTCPASHSAETITNRSRSLYR